METLVQFDNVREAQDIAGKGFGLLDRIAQGMGVRLTARDCWIKIEGIAICELDDSDVVRHELVQRIIQAYRKRRAPGRRRPRAPAEDAG